MKTDEDAQLRVFDRRVDSMGKMPSGRHAYRCFCADVEVHRGVWILVSDFLKWVRPVFPYLEIPGCCRKLVLDVGAPEKDPQLRVFWRFLT